jgi:hypothetical protein
MAHEPIAQSLPGGPEPTEAPADVTTAPMSNKLATEADGDVTMGGATADDDDYVHVSMAEGIA